MFVLSIASICRIAFMINGALCQVAGILKPAA